MLEKEMPEIRVSSPTDQLLSCAIPSASEIVWDSSFEGETVKIAFEESQALQAQYTDWAKSADGKAVAVFAVACGIVSIAPSVGWGSSLAGWGVGAWVVAVLAALGAIASCYGAYKPEEFRTDPVPAALLGETWMRQTPDAYRFYRIRDMAKTHEHNMAYLNRRAEKLSRAMLLAGVEIAALAAAYLSHLL